MTLYDGQGRELFSGKPSSDYIFVATEDRFRTSVREQPPPAASYVFALRMANDIAGLDPVLDKDTFLGKGKVSESPTGFLDGWFE